jgi:hypothetical protein
MIDNDHDLLITLSTKLEAHSQRESEVSRATLAEVSKLGTKMDAITTAHYEHARDLRDMKARQRDDDIRIATLEQQVDTLQDTAEQTKAISMALIEESEKHAKRWAWIAVISSPVVAIVVPLILKWLAGLIAALP